MSTLVGKEESNPEPESGKTNLFACNICKRNYSRVDHLTRHYRSHIHEKLFICQTCNKSFARGDLLKRHSANHRDQKNIKRPQNSSLQSRVAQACVACASSKLKCSNERPCCRCQLKGIECILLPVTEKPKRSLKGSIVPKKGAVTSSSMDGQRRLLHFQDASHKKIAQPTSSGSEFSLPRMADLETKKADAWAAAKETEKRIAEPTQKHQDALAAAEEVACEAVGYAQQEALQQRGTLEQQHSDTSDPFQSQAQAWCQPLNDHSPNALPQQGDRGIHVQRWDEDLLQTFDPFLAPQNSAMEYQQLYNVFF